MSLYDDLGVGASDTKTEGWSKNFKLLQSQLKVKKAALTQAKVNTASHCTQHRKNTQITHYRPESQYPEKWPPHFWFYKVCVDIWTLNDPWWLLVLSMWQKM